MAITTYLSIYRSIMFKMIALGNNKDPNDV